jgi:SAM-dependent methyltransferase
MCNSACLQFIKDNLSREEAEGRKVLEVGSLYVNGSPRGDVMSLSPLSYTGVDLSAGPGVDVVCRVEDLAGRFGAGSFDIVLSTEMLEHVRDWRSAISNLKEVLKPGGLLLITTRSKGYPYHGYPNDFWRYEEDDLRAIFSDMTVLAVGQDQLVPGIFAKVRKLEDRSANDLSRIELYSVISGKRQADIGGAAILAFKIERTARDIASFILPGPLKRLIKKLAAGRGGTGLDS